MRFYRLTLGGLATWRLTHLLYAEDGPWDSVVRLRRAAGNGFWSKLLDCFQCLSLWIAAPIAFLIGESWLERILLWFTLSALAILLQLAEHHKSSAKPRVQYIEDDEPQE